MPLGVVERIQQSILTLGADAGVCLSPENIAYSAGFVVPSQPLMRWRHAALVTTADGQQAMMCVDMEESTVRAARPDLPLRVWREFSDDPMGVLASQLGDLGLGSSRIGIELDYLPASAYERLSRLLPSATFVPIDDALAATRQIKTPDEISLLTRLARMADTAIGDSFRAVRAGCTEMELAAELTTSLYRQGAEQFKLMIVATGERSQLPNVGPSERVLRPGDVCRVEIFPVIGGYHAGVCRTAVVGEPPPEAERIYNCLVSCRQAVLETIKDGIPAADVYRAFEKQFAPLGLAPISFVGHGIGVDLHESPYLALDNEQILRTGMVFGVEPLAYGTGYGFGMQIKDIVAVGPDGCRVLSDVTDTRELARIDG